MNLILEALYLMLPAYIADMTPVFARYLPWPATPVDGGKSWRGVRILGDHKTYRGLIAGVIAAVVVVLIQKYLDTSVAFFDAIGLIDYKSLSLQKITLIGLLLGGGALVGDMIKSFFKRQMHIEPGKPWIPFDHMDSSIGAVIAISFYFPLSWQHIVIILVISPLIHVLSNVIGYMIKVRKTPI